MTGRVPNALHTFKAHEIILALTKSKLGTNKLQTNRCLQSTFAVHLRIMISAVVYTAHFASSFSSSVFTNIQF